MVMGSKRPEIPTISTMPRQKAAVTFRVRALRILLRKMLLQLSLITGLYLSALKRCHT